MTDYEIIDVNGYTKFDLFDDFNGTCENVLFDQTGSGNRARLEAMGSGDWVIRNVAFKGKVGTEQFNDSAQIKPAVYGDGHGLIENVYLGDGAASNTECNGVLVQDRHAGTLTFRNCHISGFTDNGLYGSDPGYFSSSVQKPGGGEVHIENCYAHHNNITQFRIGSEGSYIRDSVANVEDMNRVPRHKNGGHNARGVRMHHTDKNRVENSDIASNGGHAIQAKNGGGGTIENTRVSGSISDKEGPINGKSVGDPDTTPPEGVPMTAEEAASGTAADGGTPEPLDPGTPFEVIAPSLGSTLEYEFEVDGDVYPHRTSEKVWSGSNDTITNRDDGTTHVSGSTGNGYGDAYLVDGWITSFSDNSETSKLIWDGTEYTVDTLIDLNPNAEEPAPDAEDETMTEPDPEPEEPPAEEPTPTEDETTTEEPEPEPEPDPDPPDTEQPPGDEPPADEPTADEEPVDETTTDETTTEELPDGHDPDVEEPQTPPVPDEAGPEGVPEDLGDPKTLAVRSDSSNASPIEVYFNILGEVLGADSSGTNATTNMRQLAEDTYEVKVIDLAPGESVRWQYRGIVAGLGAPDGTTIQFTSDEAETPLPDEVVPGDRSDGLTEAQIEEVRQLIATAEADDASDDDIRAIVKEELRELANSLAGYGN